MAFIKHYTKSQIEINNNSTVAIGYPCRLGVSYDKQPDSSGYDTYFEEQQKDFTFLLYQGDNATTVTVGRTHIYELTEPINISKIEFPNGVPDTIGIDIIYEAEEEVE